MVRGKISERRGEGRTGRHPRKPSFDALEPRVVLNASLSEPTAIHALSSGNGFAPIIGTLQGRVTNTATGRGLNNVRVQLIDSTGQILLTTISHAGGFYRFRIRQLGPYVVHVVTPRRFVQTTPTFVSTHPTGSYATNPATGMPYNTSSWNYHTGNSNPANGPVGPPFWSSIVTQGSQPFESPIDITGAPTNLGQVLSINYNNVVPKAIVNNGYQIQVQIPSGAASITLGGQVFTLAQFHYHDPSENTVNGQSYSMEEHFVNVSATGAETVLAVFLQLGPHNDALDPILNAAMTSLTSPNTTTTISQPINFAGLLPTSMMGWYYQGSLTTPPLSQALNWLVFSTPITLDYGQLQEYEQVASDSGFLPNNRPVQPTDGRQVNQIDYDVNFVGPSVNGLNFGLTPAGLAGTTTALSASSTTLTQQPGTSSTLSAQALPVLNGHTPIATAAAAQGYMPVAGCNCPLCQMLRNAVWHQVHLSAASTTAPPPASTAAAISIPASAYSPAL